MKNLNRQWIGKGGLFSGARLQAGQEYVQEEDMAKQRYLTGWEQGQEHQKMSYERSMEDYGKAQQRAGATYGRGTEDIARQKIKEQRSLQEYYQQAIGQRMANTLGESYYGYSY
jgi:hypothetical protein